VEVIRRHTANSCLNRDTAIAAAVAIADNDGLSMRRIAKAPGVEATSLYNQAAGGGRSATFVATSMIHCTDIGIMQVIRVKRS
jgi:hypothetical protein